MIRRASADFRRRTGAAVRSAAALAGLLAACSACVAFAQTTPKVVLPGPADVSASRRTLAPPKDYRSAHFLLHTDLSARGPRTIGPARTDARSGFEILGPAAQERARVLRRPQSRGLARRCLVARRPRQDPARRRHHHHANPQPRPAIRRRQVNRLLHGQGRHAAARSSARLLWADVRSHGPAVVLRRHGRAGTLLATRRRRRPLRAALRRLLASPCNPERAPDCGRRRCRRLKGRPPHAPAIPGRPMPVAGRCVICCCTIPTTRTASARSAWVISAARPSALPMSSARRSTRSISNIASSSSMWIRVTGRISAAGIGRARSARRPVRRPSVRRLRPIAAGRLPARWSSAARRTPIAPGATGASCADAEALTASGRADGAGRLEGVIFHQFELSEPFALSAEGTFSPPADGKLYLRCRDQWNALDDNTGHVNFSVRKSAAAGVPAPAAAESPAPAGSSE